MAKDFTSETGKEAGQRSTRKGVKDAFTKKSMERIRKVLDQLEETLTEDIQSLPKHQRVRLWFELQEYVNPKLQRTDLTSGDKPINVHFDKILKDA